MTDSAWPEIQQLLAGAGPTARLLPAGKPVGAELGLSEASFLGAVAENCGGLLIDHGWVKILGTGASAGGTTLASLVQANPDSADAGYAVVAYDVLGGVFALDGGAMGDGEGEVFYFSPDTLAWEGLETGYDQFVTAMLDGAADDFYADVRWEGWETEVGALGVGEALAVYPFPFTDEGADMSRNARRPAPLKEVVSLYQDFAAEEVG